MSRLIADPIARNLSPLDRSVRLSLGVLLVLLAATGVLHGLGATAAYLFAWVPLVTGAAGWCPFYTLLGIRSRGR
jgi:hypothetical protein